MYLLLNGHILLTHLLTRQQFISEAQPQLVPLNAPSGAFKVPESNMVSLDQETLTHSMPAMAPQDSDIDLQ